MKNERERERNKKVLVQLPSDYSAQEEHLLSLSSFLTLVREHRPQNLFKY